MAKRIAKPHASSQFHVVCPFCGAACDKSAALTWCAGCHVEYRRRRDGVIEFDNQLRTPRFAYAKAVMKAGGLSMTLPHLALAAGTKAPTREGDA